MIENTPSPKQLSYSLHLSQVMEQAEEPFPKDEALWTMAQQRSFVPPPRQWAFGTNIVSFGSDTYNVDASTMYELALLDIHAQYWESTVPESLRRYYRRLQFNVEQYFQSNSLLQIHHTPSFINPWLSRTVFRKPHNQKGRDMMSHILTDIPEPHRSKLEMGDFYVDGISFFISPKHIFLSSS